MSNDVNSCNVHELAGMLRNLSKIEMPDWYRYAFSRDPLDSRFTDEQKRTWMRQALECGSRYSHLICAKHHTKEPKLLAKAMGMHISYITEHTSDQMIFAQYQEPDQILINREVITQAENFVKNPEVTDVLSQGFKITDLILAHELYHHVEELYQDEIFTQNEKVRLWSLGPFHNDSKIIALSEIAAMSFARELTQTSYSPYLMDILLMYGYSSSEAVKLYREMLKSAGEKSGQNQGKGR